jgi:hypothetical protein
MGAEICIRSNFRWRIKGMGLKLSISILSKGGNLMNSGWI